MEWYALIKAGFQQARGMAIVPANFADRVMWMSLKAAGPKSSTIRRPEATRLSSPSRFRPKAPILAWSIDFLIVQSASGQRSRAPTEVDMFTRDVRQLNLPRFWGCRVNTILSRVASGTRRGAGNLVAQRKWV